MLGKLIKHDWKSIWKTMFMMNAILVIMTIIGIISFQTPLWSSDIPQLNVLAGIILVVYYISLIVVAFASFIFLSVHFYKNLYSDEGYLTHTLPVTPSKILLAKLIVAVSWTIITTFVIVVSVLTLLYSVLIKFADGFTILLFTEAINIIIDQVALEIGTPFPLFILAMISFSFVSSVCGMLMIYGSISIGQLWSKHKVLGSIFTYVGIYIILETILTMALATFSNGLIVGNVSSMASSSFSLSRTIWSTMFTSTGIMLVIGIILFFLSSYIMKKKLNLD